MLLIHWSHCVTLKVYSVPMLLLIGWRGKPGIKDEPQHIKQGEIQIPFLNTLDIPYQILSSEDNDKSTSKKIQSSITNAEKYMRPHALVVEKIHSEKPSQKI